MTRYLLYVAILLGAGLPAGWFFAAGLVLPGLLAIGAGLGWLAIEVLAVRPATLLKKLHRPAIGAVAGPGLVLLVGMVAWALLTGMPAGVALAGILAALAAWDLARFAIRLALVPDVSMAARLERRHLARLGLALAAGTALAALALLVHLSMGLVWALLLGGLAVFALTRAARLMQK